MMIRDVPFPSPLSVIFSPIHITNMVPAVSNTMVDIKNIERNPASMMAGFVWAMPSR
jgi:hypothetical protein